VRDQPVAVGGEAGVIPDRIVHADADKPAIELVVIEVLAQLPLGAQSIDRLQHKGHNCLSGAME
jgi:hypothetical protein